MNPHLALIVSEAYCIWTGTMFAWCLLDTLVNEPADYICEEE